MKFLHEYLYYDNGKTIDNGYWEIDGDRLVNACGGWHPYDPSPDDEIIESDWDYINWLRAKDAISDKYTTGWIAPDGTFYGCDYQNHHYVAEYLDMTETMMENKGYIKIYLNPIWTDGYGDKYEYFSFGHMTQAQIDTLINRGFKV